jgi:uncharacterized protein (TIGR02145 family)
MKTRSFILLALVVLVNLQVYAQTYLTRNGKLTTIAGEAVSANGAIGAATIVGRDGNKVSIAPPFSGGTFDGFTYNLVTSATTRVWLDRNLGATRVAASQTDAASYGNLYQWGRASDGHERRTSGTTAALSAGDVPGNNSFITINTAPNDWRSQQNNNLWQGVNGTNNPCPAGFRLPTETELDAERARFSPQNAAGAFASVLKLPMAGIRGNSDGGLRNVNSLGYYWSSTVSVSGDAARGLRFGSLNVYMDSPVKAHGFSVRCIKD